MHTFYYVLQRSLPLSLLDLIAVRNATYIEYKVAFEWCLLSAIKFL